MRKDVNTRIIAALLASVTAWTAFAGEASPEAAAPEAPSDAAFKQASAAGRHLFILFFSEDDEATRNVRKVLDEVLGTMSETAQQIVVKKGAPEEAALQEKYGVNEAPMPLLLVLAPNGALTLGCLGGGVTEEKLRSAIAGPAQQQCLKALQDRKRVILSACTKAVAEDAPALKGIREFTADPRYSDTAVIRFDPTDQADAVFAKRLGIDPMIETTTVLLLPPRTLVMQITGEVSKDGLIDAFNAGAPG